MKTKHLFCAIVFSFLFLKSFCQSYDSLVVENAQWKVIWDYEETPWVDEMSGWLLRGDTTEMCMLTEQIGWPVIVTDIQYNFEFGKERKYFRYDAAADLQPGMYFVNLFSENKIIYSRKLFIAR